MAVEYQVKYTPGFDPTIVNVSQNDVGRQFDLKIIDETGAAQQIPSGSTVKFVGMKPSGLGFTVNCTFTNSVVHVTTTDIMTDEHGLIPAEVQITNGNTVIGTANVNLRVEKNPHPEGTIDDNLIRIVPTFEVIYQRLDILESSMYTAENNISNLQTRVGIVEVKADDAYDIGSQAATMASAHAAEIGGIKRGYDGTVYQTAGDAVRAQAFRGTDTTLSVSGKAADAKATGDSLTELKEDLTITNAQFPSITGAIIPPSFEFGARWVNNGTEAYSAGNTRVTFKRGQYIDLEVGDVINIDKSVINVFGGGYTIDGTTFTAVTSQASKYTVQVSGKYFWNLFKSGDAEFTEEELANAWKYISFTRSGNMKEDIADVLALEGSVNDIKTVLEYEIVPEEPTDFYDMPYVGKGINYLGQEVDEATTDASGYIDMTDLYDIAIVVPNKTKYSLGGIFYYNDNNGFIKRVLPGTNYEFSVYNGEDVIWLNIDKTVPNAKYVRFVEDNRKGYKYWIVNKAPKAGVLDDYAKMPFEGKKIVNFGDSIFGQTRPPRDVSTYLAEKTGATVYNAGFGGCEMSRHADTNYNAFSMYMLADAVASGNWTAQETASSASGMPAYFAETVTMLKSLDFSDIDIVTIAYGTNDWGNGSPLDNGGKADMAYFGDALRYSIETLLTAFPNLRIFVCTQTYRFWMDAQGEFTEDSNTRTSSQGTKLTDFVAKTIEIAKEYQLPYIDDYEIGMNRYNRSFYFYPTDGTHPKPTGNQLIADNIASKIY